MDLALQCKCIRDLSVLEGLVPNEVCLIEQIKKGNDLPQSYNHRISSHSSAFLLVSPSN